MSGRCGEVAFSRYARVNEGRLTPEIHPHDRRTGTIKSAHLWATRIQNHRPNKTDRGSAMTLGTYPLEALSEGVEPG